MINTPLNKVNIHLLAEFLIKCKNFTPDAVADYGDKVSIIVEILDSDWEWECLDYVYQEK